MAEKITPEIFNKMVELAALELTAKEAEYLRKELNNQLAAIDELTAIPIDESVPPAAHGVPYRKETAAPLREDQHEPFADVADILSQVPEMEDGYIVVQDIPHEDLS